MRPITFVVKGKAEPAGSKSSFVPVDKNKQPFRGAGGRIIVNTVDANPKLKGWQKVVKAAAFQAWTQKMVTIPLKLTLVICIERPKNHYRTGKFSHLLREGTPSLPAVKPDNMKMCRGIEDAMTGICYSDDALLVQHDIRKIYGPEAWVRITLEEAISDPDQPTLL